MDGNFTPGEGDDGGGGSLNPHSHLSLWMEEMETSHAVWLRNVIDSILWSRTLNFCLFSLKSFTFIYIF